MNDTMRRSDRRTTDEEAWELLEKGEYGILSTVSEDGTPYGVPLSYAVWDGKIVFHGAAGVGKKLRNITACPQVCFTVVGNTNVLPAKFSTEYESVIAFGTAAFAEDKPAALMALVKKYAPEHVEAGEKYIASAADQTDVICITVTSFSGKARRKKSM